MSPVTSRKRKALGPAESSDSTNKRARVAALPSQPDCNNTRQSTDDEPRAALQASRPIPSIDAAASSHARPAPGISRLRLQRRQGPLHGNAYDFKGNYILLPNKDDLAVLDTEEPDTLLNRAARPTSMIGLLNKHRRDMAAKKAKAQRATIEAAQQQLISAEAAPQNKFLTDAISAPWDGSTPSSMEETTKGQPPPNSETTVQSQTQTPPPSEPSLAQHTQPSVPSRRWGLSSIVDSVSRFVPSFNRTPVPAIQGTTADSQTNATQADVALQPTTEAIESSNVTKPSHKSVGQRKASNRRQKAHIDAEKQHAEFMQARKLEIDNEVTRRVIKAMKEQHEAEEAAHPGQKRKRFSPPVIPNPVGVSYGFDPEFFASDSDSDEEPAPVSPSQRPTKRVRLNLEPTTRVFPSNEIIRDPFRARPYLGSMFADQPRKSIYAPSLNRTFAVPDASDSDEETIATSAPAPHKTTPAAKTITASERKALIDAEYTKIYNIMKKDHGHDEREGLIKLRTNLKVDNFIRTLPPLEPEPAPTRPGESAEPDSLARARQRATQYSPKQPSALRSVSRLSTPSIGTPSDDGNNVKVYEPNENTTTMPVGTTNGNATKPLRGILKPWKGSALREVSGNMVPTKVNDRQTNTNEGKTSGNESRVSGANEGHGMGKPVELQPEQPPADISIEAEIGHVSPPNLATFQFFQPDHYGMFLNPIVLQQIEKNWTQADTDRAVQVGAKEMAKYFETPPSGATK